MIRILVRLAERPQPALEAVVHQVDAAADNGKVRAGQLEYGVVEFEADGPARADLPPDPVQRVG